MKTQEIDTRQCKVAFCKDCGGWKLLADMPFAETDRAARTDYARAAAAGHTIKIVPPSEAHAPGMCNGHRPPVATQSDLFATPQQEPHA